jgi:hypothetical protein
MFFAAEAELKAGVVWPDGIPIVLPLVDIVLVPRERLAPRRWLKKANDIVMFSSAELEPFVRSFPKAQGEMEWYELLYGATPDHVERAIRDKKPPAHLPTGVPFEQVLDRELVEQAKADIANAPS